MIKFIMMVLPQGQDIIAELVEEKEDRFIVREPRFVAFNPEAKQVAYVDYVIHAKSKEAIPMMKLALLTWYEPKDTLGASYMQGKARQALNERGVVVPPSGIVAP